MKLIFFLIAFCLISLHTYFSWSDKDREKRGVSESDMVIKSDNFYEEIKYYGNFQIADDETSFKTISPGGYFKYRKNEIKVNAESNLQGTVEYSIYDGKNTLAFDEQGKKLVAAAIHEMIAMGFDANNRMERIYKKGGVYALLNEVDSLKMDNLKVMYLNRIFMTDSLLPDEFFGVVNKIKSLGSDRDKADFLNKISKQQLKNPQTDSVYFEIVKKIGSDMDKVNALNHLINRDSLSAEDINKILQLSSGIGSDMDKANLFIKLIEKELITGPATDSLLERAADLGSDMDKMNIYSKIVEEKSISDPQWIKLIHYTTQLGSDMDKTNLLIKIAQKIPKTETLKTVYMIAAKSIGNDSDYGRAVRALD